jgi:hypothetical protein
MKGLMDEFGISAAEAGVLLGKGFARGLRRLIPGVAAAANALREAAEKEGILLRGRKITIELGEKEKKARGDREGAEPSGGGGGGPMGGTLVTVGRQLQGMGYLVGEHPAFGGVHGGHVSGSYHFSGRAIDINWPGGGIAERNKLDAIYGSLARLPHAELIWRAANHGGPSGLEQNAHIHFAMAKGGFGTVARATHFIAGEKGPEDFAFMPHSKGGLGGGRPLIVHVHGNLVHERDLGRYLRDIVRDAASDGIMVEPVGPGF